MDLTYRLTRLRVADELFVVNGAYLAALVGADAADVAALATPAGLDAGHRRRRPGSLPRRAHGRGREGHRRGGSGLRQRLLSAVPGLATSRVEAARLRARTTAAAAGDGAAHWKLRYKGAARDIFFHHAAREGPGLPGDHARRGRGPQVPGGGRGRLPAAAASGRGLSLEFSLPFAPGDKRDADKVRALFTDASKQLIDDGAYFSRPYGEWADPVYNRDAAGRDALRTVKKIVDPNNVLNPSKLCF